MDVTPSDQSKPQDLNPEEFEESRARPPASETRLMRLIFAIPWWFVILTLMILVVFNLVRTDETYRTIYDQIMKGFSVTLRITLWSYALALVLGLVIGVIRSTTPRPRTGLRRSLGSFLHLGIYQFATFFVEVMRGLPLIIVLLISSYVFTPQFKAFVLETFDIELKFKGSSIEVAIAALAMVYAAYISEIFRAGIQSIEKGQIEAARSLGMNMYQTTILIVLPQAVRRVIPPLGNDFIAMIKDSALALVVGVRDMSQMAKLWAGSTFRYEQTYLVLATIYLTMTVLGSIVVRIIEHYVKTEER